MELVPIIQILSSSEVVKWLLKCPLYNFGVKGKKGLATTLIFMRKGQARVFIIRMIRINLSSALPNLIVFEKSSFRTEWGFKPRAPCTNVELQFLTGQYGNDYHKRFQSQTLFFFQKQQQQKKTRTRSTKRNEVMQRNKVAIHCEKVMQRIILIYPSHPEAKKKRVRGISFRLSCKESSRSTLAKT